MSKIYLPSEFLGKPCYIINSDYIRVYNSINSTNNTVYDIYFKNDYMVKRSTSNYSTSTLCDSYNVFTDNIIYRYDFSNSLICFSIMFLFIIFIPLRLTFFRIFRRFR